MDEPEIRKALRKRCKPEVAAMHMMFPKLVNYVHNENIAAKRWLKWMGFTMEEPLPMGPLNELFCRFEKVR